MSWDLPLPKTPEQLSESQEAQRKENLARHVAKIEELEKRIVEAQAELEKISKDTEEVHARRLDEYLHIEDNLENLKRDLDFQGASIESKRNDLMVYDKRIIAEHKRAWDEIKNGQITNGAHKDQLDSTKIDLDKVAQIQIETAAKQKATEESLVQRCAELDQHTRDANALTDKLVADHHDLKAKIEEHVKNVEIHQQAVSQLQADQEKNKQFYEAIVAREKDLEPLKIKLQQDIDANAKETQRLSHENLKVYQLKVEADKRIMAAEAAEQMAKEAALKVQEELEKLNNLKNELASQIKET